MRFPGRLLLILACAPLLLALAEPAPAYWLDVPPGWVRTEKDGITMDRNADRHIACTSAAIRRKDLDRYTMEQLNPSPATAWNSITWSSEMGVRTAFMIVTDTGVTLAGDYQVQTASMLLAPTAIDSTSPEAFSTQARILLPGWEIHVGCFTGPKNRRANEGIMRQIVGSVRLN